MGAIRSMRLLQLGDSLLPVGSFSFSNAVESAVQEGRVTDVSSLRAFVRTATQRAAASDGVGLLEAHRAARAGGADRIVRSDVAVFTRKLHDEMRTQTVRTGKKLAEVATRIADLPLVPWHLEQIRAGTAPGTYPVVLGVVCAALEVTESEAFAIHQYGTAMTMLSAALRLMRIDHLETQAVLYEINSGVERDYAKVATLTLTDMAAFAPMTDILAAAHVQSHVRMFMN